MEGRRRHDRVVVAPMPLRRLRVPFDDAAWLYELKLDGFRALAHVDSGDARLVSRNGHRFRAFAPLCVALAAALDGRDAILDGEIVCLDRDGRSDFDALFYRRAEPYFYAFDCLMLDGKDLRARSSVAAGVGSAT
jgi:bifunctional non-homologous end joining protein LigD